VHVTAALEDADHRPVAVAEADAGAHGQARELGGRLASHHDLADPRLEAAPLHQARFVTNGEGALLHAAERHVVGMALTPARQVHHDHQLGRSLRAAAGVAGHPGQRRQHRGLIAVEAARHLGVGAGPQHDHAVAAAGAGQRVAKPFRHREHGD